MTGLQNLFEQAKSLLGMGDDGPVTEHIGRHRVVYDEGADELYCLRCYREAESKRDFVKNDCDGPELEHDPAPFWNDSGNDLDVLGYQRAPARQKGNDDPDGYECLRCGKYAETRDALEDMECDPY